MPALTIIRKFTTKPFAGDDLQIVCMILGSYRVIQLFCIIPIIVKVFADRFQGRNLLLDGYAYWCPQYQEVFDYDRGADFVLTVDDLEGDGVKVTQKTFMASFIIVAAVYTFVDFSWLLSVWGAASMGTPTQPRGRDEYLRKLILFKMSVINLFPVSLLVLGIIQTYRLRRDNYGCGDGATLLYYPDKTWWFALFCVLLVTYSLELLIFPAMLVNKFMRWLRRNKFSQQFRYATKAKGERLETCLGGLLKCLSVVCCNKAGGKELKNQGEMKDFASNLMEFANNDAQVGVVLSDMYVGGKLLARVQAERRMNAIQALQHQSNRKEEKEEATNEEEEGSKAPTDRRNLLASQELKSRKSILTLQTNEDGNDCIVVEKNVLTSSSKKDVDVLKNAAHYSLYAQFIYFHVRMALEDLLAKDSTTFIRDFNLMTPMENYSFAMFEAPHAHIFYANFYNGIAATPYVILVDEEEKSVVIAVRGTISLEDWVIDLQYVPHPLDKVGELCGFNGKGHHCHKGVLTRAKWMYNDIKKQRMLKHLYSDDSIYKDYNLVVVGHSLGGGCAQVLSLMLRPSFPSLRCYAFEPPGCIFDDVLSEDAKEWIISVVRHEDVVPRVTQPNLESLRDEFFDVVARIKVPKCQVFSDVRTPCPDSHLQQRNARVLCKKGEIDRDTAFYEQLQKFRTERAAKNQTSGVAVKLYIPGNIIYLVDTTGDGTKYVPYWASRYEFNQVILSGRMLADHSIPPLVKILRELDLDDIHEVHTWHVEQEIGEEDAEIVTFIPFSNPQGKLPLVLVLLCIAGCIIGSVSNQVCKYISRTTMVYDPRIDLSYEGTGLSGGLWSYNLKQCKDPGCDTSDFSNLEDSQYCQAYGSAFNDVDGYWKSSRAFASLSVLLGLVSIFLISFASCTKLKKKTWLGLVAMLLLATLFQGLQLLLFRSDLCTVWTHPETGERVDAKCTISTGGILGIVTTILWFTSAIGCSRMAKMA